MRRILFLFCLLPLFCASCVGKSGPALPEDEEGREVVDVTDPSGPIPAPNIPPELARKAPDGPSSGQDAGADGERTVYAYTVECVVRRPDAQRQPGASGPPDSPDSPDAPDPPDLEDEEFLAEFKKTSSLYRLLDKPPQSRIGLEQRLAVALQEGRDVLRSQGYYSGRVRGGILAPGEARPGKDGEVADTAVARILFFPGQRYVIGRNSVSAALPAMDGEDGQRARKRLPKSLDDAGLPEGSPAVAANVLAAVEKIREGFLNNGFPFADITGSRYIVDHQTKTLEAEITVRPGPFARMGDLLVRGEVTVRPAYFEAMRAWRKGRPWSQRRIEALRESLRQSGLFQSIDIEPAEKDEDGARGVVLTVSPAAERTVSGAVKYHTDFGPGVQGSWEHRNLTGKGDSLRITAPLWMDMQEVTASYRLPFFLRRDQDFIASGGFVNQDTDAYRMTSAAGSAGLQRRLSRFWTASLQGSVQGGSIKEPDEPGRDYLMYGLPMTLTYDSTRNLLNASRGQRLMASVAPYAGEYDGDFSVLRTRLEGQAFVPLVGQDTLLLALKGVVGMVGGEHSSQIPPSVRFYSGGGGSVRGYEFQSIGPRNDDNDPLGGGSLVEVSSEARWKITPEWGLVAFVDGGTAYKDVFDDPGRQLRWGAGLGLRYYTVIGPVRLDVATPLNPRDDDDPLQLYISIGQSF